MTAINMTELLTDLTTATSDHELWDIHRAAMKAFGFDHLLYGCTRYRSANSLGDPLDWVVLTSYPDGFMVDYVGLGHIRHAPMVRWALEHQGQSCSWQIMQAMVDNNELTPRELEVLAFNRRFGITSGVTISFEAASDRTRAAIAMAGGPGRTQADIDAIWDRHKTELTILNNVMHLKLMSLPHSGHRHLTRRQIEVLQWTGDGKTVQDIAVLLGLTPATVEKHLRLARTALDVETTAQAVLKAAFHNQMFILPRDNEPKVRET